MLTDHMRDASRLVSAVESLCLTHAHTGQEDGSLVDRFVNAANVADDNIARDGACLDMEAKLSKCCRMFRAKRFLPCYQCTRRHFYLHQMFCQDDGELA